MLGSQSLASSITDCVNLIWLIINTIIIVSSELYRNFGQHFILLCPCYMLHVLTIIITINDA